MRDNGKHLDKYRRKHPSMGGSPNGALWGYFRIRFRDGMTLDVISSGERHAEHQQDPGAWEHVSVSHRTKTPTWDHMAHLKKLFWRPDETVVQYHPPESEYVSVHDHCLHLWKPPWAVTLPPLMTLGPVTGARP